jgi:hypothetical protein
MISARISRILRTVFVLFLAVPALPVHAQQTGAISGTVTDSQGLTLPGVTVEARSNVLPGPRETTTGAAGEYRLPALPPGSYTIKFTLTGMQDVTRQAEVQLGQDTVADAKLGLGGVSESVQVTAVASLIDREAATIKSGLSNEQIAKMPVGQQYRDLIKLIPGVQYTQDQTRGPSAGGSGQDNVYQFDGVNVTTPLFGTLAAEPASHDIAQITTIKGGARAIDFDRSGGFTIDSVSKSGTNQFTGQLSYQFQNANMSADQTTGQLSRFSQDRAWVVANVGGPIIPNRLNFYASYFRPTQSKENRANLYGDLPKYDSTRNEGFLKLTFRPINAVLVNASYRDSKRLDKSTQDFTSTSSPTSGSGSEFRQKIGTVDGSWVINNRSHVVFKYTDFTLDTQGRPDTVSPAVINTAVGTRLDIGALDTQGRFTVPLPVAGQDAYNAFIGPIISRYGYNQGGAQTGGGVVGYGVQFDNDNFFRKSGQIAYNITFGETIRHELHAGYQRYSDEEDLIRSSNGWGAISVPGGRLNDSTGRPIYYQAAFQQQGAGLVPAIHSEYGSQSFEINDQIHWNNFTFNAGLVASNDTLYGQGLREDSSTLSGYTLAPGNKYKMYDLPFKKMIQPRVGATWAYNGKDTIYGSYAKYNPAASSLPRAASWDRNLATTIMANFDQNGVLFSTSPLASSSGKLFVDDLTPRGVDEYLLGTAKQFTNAWSARLYYRYRRGSHFWEDTNNTARTTFNPPPGIPQELYIPDLTAKIAQIGSGSSYVIAELDGAYTRYHEVTLESEWRTAKAFVRGSYTYSHYYGNFDQDNTTTDNDQNIFIGSSNIADGAGRQLWNFRDGTLRGDRPNMLKIYGSYNLKWNASVGAFAIYQSGQPWETWSYEPYIALTTNTSDTGRYAEKAGSRRTPDHYQLDLNYTQNVRIVDRYRLQFSADLFNAFNKQTGYSYQPSVHLATFGQPRLYYDPRRIQVAARFEF